MYQYNREGISKCVLYIEVFSIVSSNQRVHYRRFSTVLPKRVLFGGVEGEQDGHLVSGGTACVLSLQIVQFQLT